MTIETATSRQARQVGGAGGREPPKTRAKSGKWKTITVDDNDITGDSESRTSRSYQPQDGSCGRAEVRLKISENFVQISSGLLTASASHHDERRRKDRPQVTPRFGEIEILWPVVTLMHGDGDRTSKGPSKNSRGCIQPGKCEAGGCRASLILFGNQQNGDRELRGSTGGRWGHHPQKERGVRGLFDLRSVEGRPCGNAFSQSSAASKPTVSEGASDHSN